MSFKKWIPLPLLAFFFGCTLSPKIDSSPPIEKAPPFQSHLPYKDLEKLHSLLEKQLKEDSRINMQWWTKFIQARLWMIEDPQLSCEYFEDLSNEERFPLNDLAKLKALALCERSETTETTAFIEQAKEKPWLKAIAMQASLVQAKATGNLRAEMENYVYRSKVSTVMPEKIELMQKAIQVAIELNDSGLIKKHTQRLHRLSPESNPRPSHRDWMKIAYNLRRERKFNEARKYYKKIIRHPQSGEREIYKALYGIRTSYKLERKTQEYLEATKKMAMYTYRLFAKNKRYKRSAKSYAAFYHDTALIYIRALWTDGQIAKAHQMLIDLEKDLKRLRTAEKILWLRGRMADEKKDFKTASQLYQRGLNLCGNHCTIYEKIAWNLGWSLKKQDRLKEAAQTFALLEKKSKDSDGAKYLFWLAKTLDDLGQSLEARAQFANLIQNDPYGYYGLLAHRELGVPVSSLSVKNRVQEKSQNLGSMIADDHFNQKNDKNKKIDKDYVDWLIAVGEEEVALHFLDHVASYWHKTNKQDRKSWSELFELYARNNSFVQLFRQLGALSPELKGELLEEHPQSFFHNPIPRLLIGLLSALEFYQN